MSQNRTALTQAEILIVDDIPANLNVLRQVLEPQGYNVIAVPSGEIALQIAARTPPDLILLDIMMPGIDGFETCHRLKADPATADIPVIFITAKDETTSIVRGFQVGGVDYITKPFQHEEVRARVQTHLTIKQLRDELEADNRRKTEELETAHLIQQGFLPVSPPDLGHLEISAFQKPVTEVGGDYYDFFDLRVGELIIAIGDATGHGVGASLMVSATKMALMTVDEPDLTRKISQINSHLKQINSYHRLNMALTLVELAYDAKSDSVQVKATGGGMPPLLILRASGEVEEIMIQGLPLGAMEGARYSTTEFQLGKSDRLILMSDGLPERLNDRDEMLGTTQLMVEMERIVQTVQRADEIVEALVKLGDDWANHTLQNDDVTLVVLEVKRA